MIEIKVAFVIEVKTVVCLVGVVLPQVLLVLAHRKQVELSLPNVQQQLDYACW